MTSRTAVINMARGIERRMPNHASIDTEEDLLRLIDEEIASSVCFETDSEKDRRETALEYYRGEMKDLPALEGWSHAVSKDVAETIDFMLPGLLRVFDGGGTLGAFQPARPGDEQGAAQATDYINHVWDNDCDGYVVLSTAILDALTVRNGIIKVYWDKTPDYDTEELTGLSSEQLTLLMQDGEVEIIGYAPREASIPGPDGAMIPMELHDVRVRRVIGTGKLCAEAVPPEDFGISSGAKTIDKARFVWHRTRETRSDLVAAGHDRERLDEIPAHGRNPAENIDRDENNLLKGPPSGNSALDEIEVYECYPLTDADGDGIAERRKVVVAGATGGRKLLSDEPWTDDLPFVDLTPQIVPHRWMGQSLADSTMDLQRIKTALLRQMLNNLYLANTPQRIVDEAAIVNPDEVLKPVIGGTIRVKNGKVAEAIRDLTVPFIGDKALAGIQYIDGVIQRRTGVSMASAALDQTALDPQTATAEQLEHDASYAKLELVARNMAKIGLKKLFAKMLRIVVRNQDRPRTIRLRDEWVDVDPRPWNAMMDVTINVGLGTGSRERDLAMLRGVAGEQDKVIAELGADNPIVTPSMWRGTRAKMVEAAGLRQPEQYFADVSDDDFRQWQASRPKEPDPEAADAQARLELERQKADAAIALKREDAQADMETDRLKMEGEFRLREREMALEAELKQVQIALGQRGESETNIPRAQ